MQIPYRNSFPSFLTWVLLSASTTFWACDNYIRSEVEKSIYVNYSSLNLFIGEEVQLKVSPTDGTYSYNWTTENPDVATVSPTGLVKIIGEGNTDIIVSSGVIKQRVSVTGIRKISVSDVTLSDSTISILRGSSRTISVSLIPDNANDIPAQSWSSSDNEVATISTKGEVTGLKEGVTRIKYQVGDIIKYVTVSVHNTLPFKGPHIVSASTPLVLLAANFDFGGEGYAFHDGNAGNDTGNDNYRRNGGDLASSPVEVEGDGTNIGYTSAGEWLLYTIEVKDEGLYLLDVSLSAGGDSQFSIDIDGKNVTGSITVPNNNAWSAWRWWPSKSIPVTLTAGTHYLKFIFEQSGFNLHSIRFSKASPEDLEKENDDLESSK